MAFVIEQLTTYWAAYQSQAIGLLLVAATSYARFNTPPTSRASTTWARYHTFALFYTVAMIVSWVVLWNTPDLFNLVAAQGNGDDPTRKFAAPLYAAIVLTVAPGLPYVTTFDTRVRQCLQHLARIPIEAQRLSAALRKRTWLPDAGFQDEILSALRTAGFRDVDVSFAADRTPQALWTRITALFSYVKKWPTRVGQFADFYFAPCNAEVIETLGAEYAALATKARSVLGRLAGVGDEEDATFRDELVQGFVEAEERLETALCDLVSHAVLTCCRMNRSRRAEFETIGFVVNTIPSQMLDNLVGLGLGLTLFYGLVLTLARRPRPWTSGPVIAMIYVGAVVVAILWKRATWLPTELRVSRYALTAASAFVFASASSLGLGILLTWSVPDAWRFLQERWWPWGLTSAAVSATIAYCLDQEERPTSRRDETVVTALVCGVVAIPVVMLLANICGQSPCDSPPLWRVMLTSISTGAAVGFCAPTWFRAPETLLTSYQGHGILVSARRAPSGTVVVTTTISPPRQAGSARGVPVALPDVEDPQSSEDAIAAAVRAAREWVDRRGSANAARDPSSSRLALAVNAG